jgi:hypothetical protein
MSLLCTAYWLRTGTTQERRTRDDRIERARFLRERRRKRGLGEHKHDPDLDVYAKGSRRIVIEWLDWPKHPLDLLEVVPALALPYRNAHVTIDGVRGFDIQIVFYVLIAAAA